MALPKYDLKRRTADVRQYKLIHWMLRRRKKEMKLILERMAKVSFAQEEVHYVRMILVWIPKKINIQ